MNSAKRGLSKKMFDDIKQESTDKFLKIKLFLDEAERMEPAPPTIPSDFYNSLKGFFFVYVYGVFESCVVHTITKTIDCLNTSGVSISQCKHELLTLILSPEYNSLANVGEGKKWPKRWKISKKLSENQIIHIEETLFPTDGRNVQKKQLESLANSFGNTHPIFLRPETQGYLEEIVRFRNFIAHGDKLPQEVGRNYTIQDLKTRLTAIDELSTYLIDTYESYILNHEYLKTT